jgi:hypothetical protein
MLLNSGLIREARSQSGENIYVIRLPELMASELAGLIAEALPELSRKDPAEAIDWLTTAAGDFPLGDVIAAQALVDAAIRNHGLSIQLIAELRMRPPEQKAIEPGTRMAGLTPGIGVFSTTMQENGVTLLEYEGHEELLEPAERQGGKRVAYTNLHPYLILSHLAGQAFELAGADTTPAPRLDPDLLLGVGSSPVVLRRPGGDPNVSSVPVHNISDDLSIICHKAGIVEAITLSLLRFFGREETPMRDQLIDLALEEAEPALLARLDIALRQTAQSADAPRAAWAATVRNDRLKSLLIKKLKAFIHD